MRPETTPVPSAEDHAVVATPCPQTARAWWGDRLVAESTAALRVEEEGRPPALYFPCDDVRFEAFRDDGRHTDCPVKGRARLWSIDAVAGATGASPPSSADWDAPAATGVPADALEREGADVLWRFVGPAEGLDWLAGLAAFDHDRVRVELLDAPPDAGAGDVSTKRFPTWGDARDLADLLDVRAAGTGRFVSVARSDWRRPVVEGSQMLGQAIVGAARLAPGRRVVSAHMMFLRAADAARPLVLAFDELSAGRTMTSLAVRVDQAGRLCAAGSLLLDTTAPDVMRHEVPPPGVPGPDESEPFDMAVTGRDIRIVDGAYTGDPDAPVGPPTLDAWVRFHGIPDDGDLHAGLLAQFTGHLSIAAAMRPHAGVGQQQAHRTLSTAINAIGLSLHAPVRADRWMLYHHHTTFAGDGMTHSVCRVHDEDGRLLASFTVEAMVRGFASSAGAAADDDRTAL